MHKPSFVARLSASILSLGLVACGAGSPASPAAASSAQTPPTTLTGNWFLAGSRVPAVYPTVATTLFVTGNTITGQTSFSVQCTSAGVSGTTNTSGFPLTGTISNDGTFQASTGTISGGSSTFSLSLTGNSPLPASPAVWTGTYSVAVTPGSTGSQCGVAQTANFAATPIAPVTGTYIGVPALTGFGPGPFGAAATVTLQVTQGPSTLVTRGSASSYQFPLTGSLTIANSPCALTASTAGAPSPSHINGDEFEILFALSGSTGGVLSGTLNDPTANTFLGDLTSLAIANGCPGSVAFYNFSRK